MSKKYWPIFYSNLLNKMGYYFIFLIHKIPSVQEVVSILYSNLQNKMVHYFEMYASVPKLILYVQEVVTHFI